MNTSRGAISRLAVLALAGLMLAGCRTAQPIHTQARVQLADEEAYRQFWLHAIRSVRHFGYTLDRADPAAGVITTKPETSKQWFEFWRKDTLAAGQVAESSLHTIRRQVRLTVQPTANANEYLVDAEVSVQRQELPDRQITTPTNAVQAFTASVPTAKGAANTAEAGSYWVDLGRDGVLEGALIRQVARWPDVTIFVPSDNGVGTQPADTLPAEPAPAGGEQRGQGSGVREQGAATVRR